MPSPSKQPAKPASEPKPTSPVPQVQMSKQEFDDVVAAAAAKAVADAQAKASLEQPGGPPPQGYPREVSPGVTEMRPGRFRYDYSNPQATKAATRAGVRPKAVASDPASVTPADLSIEELRAELMRRENEDG